MNQEKSRNQFMISGILNIKKEAGFTSHDVVAKLRGIVHQKKIGHTGRVKSFKMKQACRALKMRTQTASGSA